jgi:hypothetical protein
MALPYRIIFEASASATAFEIIISSSTFALSSLVFPLISAIALRKMYSSCAYFFIRVLLMAS